MNINLQTEPPFELRLPEDCRAFIQAEVRNNASSQTDEIVRCIRHRMDSRKGAAFSGASIRESRKAKGLGQSDIADFCGVTVQAVSQWERDENAPSLGNWFKLWSLLNPEVAVDAESRGACITASPHDNPRLTSKIAELRDEIETAFDLLTAIDLAGDGIGGDVGHGISAVALAARSALDNARDMILAMDRREPEKAPPDW